MRRAIPARITKPKPYLEVGMLQHVPITDLEMQCLYYPLTPNATQSYYIQNVTYVTLEEYTVDVRVEYQSVTNEVIVTRTIVLSVITERPTVEFCNAVWKDLLPNFFVHLDQDAFVDFQPIVLKATQIKSPQQNRLNSFRIIQAPRDASELAEYIHLKNNNPVDLAKQYYALPFDHEIYTHSQLVFKTIFWNTELQYANHYLIALTRHDLALVANATFHGLQSISNELALIRQFVIDNRVALDAVTATQGGVCAIVGEGCCTYLPSESEGLGNLTIAIRNLRGIQEGIVRTNKDARVIGGYLDQQPWDNIFRFFGGHPTIAWILSIFAPIIGIILIVIVLMGCCFPIFRALILKSLHSVTNMTLIQNPVRNVTIYAPSEADSGDSTSITSNSSEESHGDD
ncbi:SYCY2 protein [Scomber scombrus]|uniref:SYCY2 protein n=1 Tax=Scomber scombrus TaxID=13677 RepID=A0AAV1N675_SCOSC